MTSSAARSPSPETLTRRPDGWLDVAAAAEALGKSERTVQAWCAGGKLHAVRVADGSRETWAVDPASRPELRLASPALATPSAGAGGGPTLAVGPLARLSVAQRRRVARRMEVLAAWRRARANRPASMGLTDFRRRWVDAHRLEHPDERLSPRTLRRWERAFADGGAAALADGHLRGGRQRYPAELWETAAGLYLAENRPDAARVRDTLRAVAAEKGWAVPPLRTVQWHLAKLDEKLRLAGRDPRAFRSRALPHATRDWTRVAAGEVWVADHRQIDVLVPRLLPDPRARRAADRRGRRRWVWRRPWLTAFLDGRSWFVPAWRLEWDGPDSDRVMGCFAAGVRAEGLPAHLYLDNGKDFRAGKFAGGRPPPRRKGKPDWSGRAVDEDHVRPLLATLGVSVTWALPYNARAKTVESWFRLMSERFDKAWDTYCGREPGARPESSARLSRLRDSAEQYASDPQNPLTLKTVRAAFGEWLTADYSLRPSPCRAAEGLSPLRAFRELRDGFEARRVPEADLSLLLLPASVVRVHASGVPVRHSVTGPDDVRRTHCVYYWPADPEEAALLETYRADRSRRVAVRRDPADPSAVWVFDASTGRYLARCEPSPFQGLHPTEEDPETVGDLMAWVRRSEKTYREEARVLRHVAHCRLLEAQRAGAEAAGLLDDPATVADLRPAIVRMPDAETGRAAESRRRHRAAPPEKDLPTLADLAATGTDDEEAAGADLPTGLDLWGRGGRGDRGRA